MKKYFLLATTALLLGTSNVMADYTTSVEVNVNAEVELVSQLGSSDLNFGRIYVDNRKISTSDDILLVSFVDGRQNYSDAVVNADDNVTRGTVSSDYVLDGEFEIINLNNGTLDLGNGLKLKNIHLVYSEGVDNNAFVEGDLYLASGPELETLGVDNHMKSSGSITLRYVYH